MSIDCTLLHWSANTHTHPVGPPIRGILSKGYIISLLSLLFLWPSSFSRPYSEIELLVLWDMLEYSLDSNSQISLCSVRLGALEGKDKLLMSLLSFSIHSPSLARLLFFTFSLVVVSLLFQIHYLWQEGLYSDLTFPLRLFPVSREPLLDEEGESIPLLVSPSSCHLDKCYSIRPYWREGSWVIGY